MSVRIGDTFRSSYQDSNPLWKVVRRGGRGIVIARVIDDLDYSGVEKPFMVSAVEGAKRWERTIKRLGSEQADFFASRKVGDIVHYNNGFKNYVRCEIVAATAENVKRGDEDMIGQLVCQPIALVGEWRAHDLPRRNHKGEIELGYYGEKIVNRTGAWQPSVTCIYEAGTVPGVNPALLPAIDLSVPEMTEAEAQAAAAERLAEAMMAALSDHTVPAVERIAAAINQTRGAL